MGLGDYRAVGLDGLDLELLMKAICMGCWGRYVFHEGHDPLPPSKFYPEVNPALPFPIPDNFVCPHFHPDYWVGRGYERNWGDGAIMNWPKLEILRKEFDLNGQHHSSLVILAPETARGPIEIDVLGHFSVSV